MYIECARRAAEKNSQDSLKTTAVILNELLADDNWLSQVKMTLTHQPFILELHICILIFSYLKMYDVLGPKPIKLNELHE